MKPGTFLLIFCSLVLAGCAQSVSQPDNPTSPPPATPVPTLSGMPNPAAVFCEQKGYKLETVTAADGSQSANCLFPDGSKCDEWAFFRGACQPEGVAATAAPAATELVAPATSVPPPFTPAPPVLRVAYWGAGQIGLWTEGGGSRRLAATNNAEVRHVRLSDDGQVVAYAADRQVMQGAYALAVVNADGSGQRVLASEEFWTSTPPISRTIALGFAPASHTLYFTTGGNDLYRVDPAQGGTCRCLPAGTGRLLRLLARRPVDHGLSSERTGAGPAGRFKCACGLSVSRRLRLRLD